MQVPRPFCKFKLCQGGDARDQSGFHSLQARFCLLYFVLVKLPAKQFEAAEFTVCSATSNLI